jgi:hypothetical protein
MKIKTFDNIELFRYTNQKGDKRETDNLFASRELFYMILRPQYLDLLKTYRNMPLEKILVGIRRYRKSTILEMLRRTI